MTLERRIDAFVKLGTHLKRRLKSEQSDSVMSEPLNLSIQQSSASNPWFTEDNIRYALHAWTDVLTESQLSEWLKSYSDLSVSPKTIAIVMAGNIPMVGFHDLLSALILGHQVKVKLSSQDAVLIPYLVSLIEKFDPELAAQVSFTKDQLTGFDAVIATGSNNTARYFEHYFNKYPNILRKNRNSVAILSGNESIEDFRGLSEDIFRYYGLGCRNVTKIFVPQQYDLKHFFEGIYHWNDVIHHNKYANNYDYNKAVELLNGTNLLDNGFLLLKESEAYPSPIGMLHWETYDNINRLKQKLKNDHEYIQCIVGSDFNPFGASQKPSLKDYADGVDTVEFLLKT